MLVHVDLLPDDVRHVKAGKRARQYRIAEPGRDQRQDRQPGFCFLGDARRQSGSRPDIHDVPVQRNPFLAGKEDEAIFGKIANDVGLKPQ